ncbi:MAG: XdhC family protein [Anaerolineae bacterium]|nr:XdhC family protein [Anaerolineae bacterium]
MSAWFERLEQALAAGEAVAVATVVAGMGLGGKMLVWPDGRCEGELPTPALTAAVREAALALFGGADADRRTFTVGDQVSDVFIEVLAPPPRLIIVGAVHLAIPLVRFARILGFHTTVVDARPIFATPERFAEADRLLVGWPDDILPTLALDAGCHVAVLSHDDKLDVPALWVALNSPARYIGALGSRKTMAKRAQRLRELGATDEQLARIHNPIGLDLGGRRAEEIALAIMAEIVAVRNGRRL